MDLPVPPPQVARMGLRAMKTIVTTDGQVHDLEKRFVDAVQRHILKSDIDFDGLTAATPDELKGAIPEAFRERILHGCLLAALIDGEATEQELAVLDSFARALDVPRDSIHTVRKLVDQHLVRFRMDVVRRSFLGQRGADFVRRNGVRGLASVVGNAMHITSPSMAARYHALEALPAGTLGRAFWEYIKKNNFSFPGEEGAGPEPIVFHDCLHVLAEYDTTSIEETQIAAFQAGTLKKDAIYGLLFPLAQFHLGVQIVPVTEGEKNIIDPDLWLKAFVRGTKTKIDLSVDWQPWEHFERPIAELRTELGIEPRS